MALSPALRTRMIGWLSAFAAGLLVGTGWHAMRSSTPSSPPDQRGDATPPMTGFPPTESNASAQLRRQIEMLERQLNHLRNANAELLQRIEQSEQGHRPRPPASRPPVSSQSPSPSRPVAPPRETPAPVITAPSLPLVSPDLTLNPDSDSADSYTDYERQALERIVRDARRQLDQAETPRTVIVERSAGKVVVDIEPYTEAGEAVGLALRREVAMLLGEERGDEFIDALNLRVRSHLSSFGQVPQQLTITRLDSGGYLIGTRTERPSAAGNPIREYRSHQVDELPERFRGLFSD